MEIFVPLGFVVIERVDYRLVGTADECREHLALRDCVTAGEPLEREVRRQVDPDAQALVIAGVAQAATAIGLALGGGACRWRGVV